ncbi:hypothetical protein [Streptomyces sp. NPDC058701]|uniref:hypothetical protein n=1 Tax=Streptomyces sp. NPDC058701 TaxID=3346608 RepID=UPI003651518E
MSALRRRPRPVRSVRPLRGEARFAAEGTPRRSARVYGTFVDEIVLGRLAECRTVR